MEAGSRATSRAGAVPFGSPACRFRFGCVRGDFNRSSGERADPSDLDWPLHFSPPASWTQHPYGPHLRKLPAFAVWRTAATEPARSESGLFARNSRRAREPLPLRPPGRADDSGPRQWSPLLGAFWSLRLVSQAWNRVLHGTCVVGICASFRCDCRPQCARAARVGSRPIRP